MENNIKKGVNRENLDETVSPVSDFYKFACGGWQKHNPLTGEYARFGVFDKIREDNRILLRKLVEELGDHPDVLKKDSIAQKVSDLFRMGLDEDRLNREGSDPLRPFIERIERMTQDDIASETAWLHSATANPFFSTGVGPDSKQSDINIFHVGEAGLSLGDRDYYLVESDTNARILEAWNIYVKRIMSLSGFSDEESERIWNTVNRLELSIAKHKMTREERRDPQRRYNPFTLDELKSMMPSFDWDVYLKGLGLDVSRIGVLNVSNPDFMRFMDSLIKSLQLREVKDYFVYLAVSASTGLLSDDFVNADFELYGRVMSGTEEIEPRWKRALAIPNSMLGEAVGELYVRRFFPAENKEYMKVMVENLRFALGEHIRNLEWMTDSTKNKALEKLASLSVKIAYPDKWKDYSEIHIDPQKSYLENVNRASAWYIADNYSKLGKPVDKDEWFMTPQTVNAYYSPLNNEICFPAGILQPPYFDPQADDAVNYGAIGVVIGHEMTHGFDDQGRQFDKDGNLSQWWEKEDELRFNALADKLVAQFDKVEVAPGVFANGRFTLGENIADQGGLRVALTAYRKASENVPSVDIDGFSPLQRFYLGYASVWANNIRDEEILSATQTDPHSLGCNRVNITLKNIKEFSDSFSVMKGDSMFMPDCDRVIIW